MFLAVYRKFTLLDDNNELDKFNAGYNSTQAREVKNQLSWREFHTGMVQQQVGLREGTEV